MVVQFPAELIQQVASHLSIPEYRQLAKLNRHIYKSLMSDYCRSYLCSQAKYLQFNLALKVPLEPTDHLLFALNSKSQLVIFHQTLNESSTVFVFTMSPSGTLTYSTSNTPLRIVNLKAEPTDNSCSFCKMFNIVKFLYVIDKGYRVFFRNWQDEVQFKMHLNIAVQVTVMNCARPVGWHGDNFVGHVSVSATRYGLNVSLDDIYWCKKILK